MIWRAARRRARVHSAIAAYSEWRSERDAVRATYRVWLAHELARMQVPGSVVAR